MARLLQFMEQLIRENQGVVEWQSSGTLQAILPEEIQKKLELPLELVTICEASDQNQNNTQDCLTIGYGTELLERAVALATGASSVCLLQAPSSGPTKSTFKVIEKHVRPLNAIFSCLEEVDSFCDYWLWTFTSVAEADERREGTCQVCISDQKASCPELIEVIHSQASRWQAREGEPAENLTAMASSAYTVALNRALMLFRQKVSGFVQGVVRRYERDTLRLSAYFNDLRQEMESEIIRRNLTGEALELRRNKQTQLCGEETQKKNSFARKIPPTSFSAALDAVSRPYAN